MIVVCDRFPQQQFTRLNDGPLLTDWEAHEIPLLRAAARRERATFAAFAACAPDLVIKLHVEPEVARRRRPEMTHEHLRAKADAIAATQYPASTRVVDVDASRPLEQVLLDVKRAVWASL
jgi:thymidylate kinase